jgi:hypothetical protein
LVECEPREVRRYGGTEVRRYGGTKVQKVQKVQKGEERTNFVSGETMVGVVRTMVYPLAGQQAQQTPGVFVRKALGCSDPERALSLAARIGVNLNHREKASRGVFNSAEKDLDYRTLAGQNALFWLDRCRSVASAASAVGFFARRRRGVGDGGGDTCPFEVVDSQGRRWTDVAAPAVLTATAEHRR